MSPEPEPTNERAAQPAEPSESSRPETDVPDWRAKLTRMPRWNKIALAVSLAFILVSGVLEGIAVLSPPASAATSPEAAGNLQGGKSFVGAGQESQQGPEAEQQQTDGAWSAGLFRLGFSFFAAFCIGFALRKVMHVALIALGLSFLFLFGLSYAELVTVDWVAIDALFQSLVQQIKAESGRFQSFITGSLPVTGLAGFGLVTGLKRG